MESLPSPAASSTSSTSAKHCLLCCYAANAYSVSQDYVCEASQNASASIDLVTGKPTKLHTIREARYSEDRCGREGKWAKWKDIPVRITAANRDSILSTISRKQQGQLRLEDL